MHRRDFLNPRHAARTAGQALGSLDELPALAPYLPEVDVLDEIAEQGRG